MNIKEVDEILKKELEPPFAPAPECNLKIIEKAKEIELMKNEKISSSETGMDMPQGNTKKRFFRGSVAAVLLIALLAASSVGAVAAVKYYNHLKAEEVVAPRKIDDLTISLGLPGLVEAFKSENAIKPEETRTVTAIDGTRYEITFVGLVSGEIKDPNDIMPLRDSSYVIIAAAREDGTPIEENANLFNNPGLSTALLISGYNPTKYTLINHGSVGEVIDGVFYYILETENVEYFSDRSVYLTVSTGDVLWKFNQKAFTYDEETGNISAVPDYDGINAIFEIPLNPETADSEKAAAIIKKVDENYEHLSTVNPNDFPPETTE